MADALKNAANAVAGTVTDAASYVSNTLAGQTAEGKAEVNKNIVTSDESSIGQKVDAAGDYLTNKKDQKSNEAQAEVDKQKLQN